MCVSFDLGVKKIEKTLTPKFLPFSSTRAKFFTGRDLTWLLARSFKETLADPINLKQSNKQR